MYMKTAFFCIVTLLFGPASLLAAEQAESTALAQGEVKIGRGYEIEKDKETERDYHPHHLSVFLGGSWLKERKGFTVGGEYEHRLHPHIGIGGLVEHAANDFKATTVAFPIQFHPSPTKSGFRVGFGPGFERAKEPRSGDEREKTDTDFLIRTMAAYDIFVSEKVSLSPNLSIDFVDGEEIFVFGVSIGFGF